MSGKFGEPWEYTSEHPRLRDANGETCLRSESMRRAVAAVNLCAGHDDLSQCVVVPKALIDAMDEFHEYCERWAYNTITAANITDVQAGQSALRDRLWKEYRSFKESRHA